MKLHVYYRVNNFTAQVTPIVLRGSLPGRHSSGEITWRQKEVLTSIQLQLTYLQLYCEDLLPSGGSSNLRTFNDDPPSLGKMHNIK